MPKADKIHQLELQAIWEYSPAAAAPRALERVAISRIRLACFTFLFSRMSLSQNRGTRLRDIF
jgi:hypothetical protein